MKHNKIIILFTIILAFISYKYIVKNNKKQRNIEYHNNECANCNNCKSCNYYTECYSIIE